MAKIKQLVDYWLITIDSKDEGITDVKVYSYEASSLGEAKRYAKNFGKVVNWHTIYEK